MQGRLVMLDLLRKLTGRSGSSAAVSVAYRPRDCHCHVIPGVDDGSRTMEESMDMLRLLQGDGARVVTATPHIYPGRFDNEPDPLRRRFDALVQRCVDEGIEIELELGAEHYLDDTLPGRIERGDILAFGPERYVLFETPTSEHVPLHLMDVVYSLSERGFTPLMAHVERYRYLRGSEGQELLEDLRCAGARFQVNRTVSKPRGGSRGSGRRLIARLQELGWVDEVGSDLHRATPDGRPYPV